MTTLTFAVALTHAEAQARSTLDVALHERLSAAVSLVKDGRVFQDSTGGWQVDSSSTQGLVHSVNGVCDCHDFHYNKPRYCKHQLAMFLSQRVMTLMAPPSVPVDPETVPEPWPDNDPEEPAAPPAPACPAVPLPAAPCRLDPRHVVTIQGKPFVKFAGLLDLAHQRGLQSLKVHWSYNDAELSLAHAVAVFPFGTFEESGDATKDNVNKKVAPHFRRCALTRAAARVLRDALNCDMVALEELGGSDEG